MHLSKSMITHDSYAFLFPYALYNIERTESITLAHFLNNAVRPHTPNMKLQGF